jgi:CRP/FNR family cyclic AMP-dependent transcriptional regulator
MMSLASVTVFNGLTGEQLALLESSSIRLEPRDGTTIFTQGEPADSIYAIVAGDGNIRIGSVDRNSKALMVEIFGSGEIFGEIGVMDSGVRTASALVEGRVQLMKIRDHAFMAALETCPSLGMALSRTFARRLRRTCELYLDAAFGTIEVRLARQLLYLASSNGRPTPQGVRLANRFRQSDLADLLGTTTRSIITILNAWRSTGLVSYDTDRAILTVHDVAALQAIVDVGREP